MTSAEAASWTKELKHHLATTRFVVSIVIIPLVVAFGLLGNGINIAVLTRRWMKSSTNYYLTALAVYDVLYLVLAFVMSTTHYVPSSGSTSSYLLYRQLLVRPLVDTCSNTGVWITLTFTVERYIGVCHPMRGKVWCTTRRARYVIAGVCLLAALVTLPEFFVVELVPVFEPETNRTRLEPATSGFVKTRFYAAYSYAVQCMFTFIPLVLLLVFNVLLIRQVVTAAKNRRQMAAKKRHVTSTVADDAGAGVGTGAGPGAGRGSDTGRDQQRITVMLIGVVIVFFVCQLPQSLQNLYRIYLDVTGSNTDEKRMLLKISANVFNLLVMVNGACNFILYSSLSSKFRRTFSRLFCRCPTGDNGHLLAPEIPGAGNHLYSSATISRVRTTDLTSTATSSRQLFSEHVTQSSSASSPFSTHQWKGQTSANS